MGIEHTVTQLALQAGAWDQRSSEGVLCADEVSVTCCMAARAFLLGVEGIELLRFGSQFILIALCEFLKDAGVHLGEGGHSDSLTCTL